MISAGSERREGSQTPWVSSWSFKILEKQCGTVGAAVHAAPLLLVPLLHHKYNHWIGFTVSSWYSSSTVLLHTGAPPPAVIWSFSIPPVFLFWTDFVVRMRELLPLQAGACASSEVLYVCIDRTGPQGERKLEGLRILKGCACIYRRNTEEIIFDQDLWRHSNSLVTSFGLWSISTILIFHPL